MWQADINYLLVLLSAIVAMVVGAIWYSPLLFGNEWNKYSGLTPEDLEKAKQKDTGKLYAFQFLATVLMSYILAQLVVFMHAISFSDGAKIGFWLWLGIVVPVLLGSVLWERKSIIVYLIDIGQYLVSLVLIGGILGLWS
ncbi:MAG: DUF1761 domain-containing protein [bacterium]